MAEITCEERDRLIREHVSRFRDDDGRLDVDRMLWRVGSSCTNFMGDGIVETTWVDAATDEPVLEEQQRRDGPDGWGDVVSCRHWVPDREVGR